MERKARTKEAGTPEIDPKYAIIIDTKGPYFVYGKPSLQQKFITPNEAGEAWEYRDGISFKIETEPVALCRCGHSKSQPFCDGSHNNVDWDPTLQADKTPLLENAEIYDGPVFQLADNPDYCVHARFCMARGTVWEAVEKSDQKEYKELSIRETFHCPSGRLKIMEKASSGFKEPALTPSLSLIEDPQKDCSGPIWVKGGIPLEDSECNPYEIRNRVTLCRCGTSGNKPYCDGTHIKTCYKDGLPGQKVPGPSRREP